MANHEQFQLNLIPLSKIFLRLRFCLVLLCCLPAIILGNTTGTVRGKVTDRKSGRNLIGVNIILEGTSLGATTNFEGEYTLPGIPVGLHKITYKMIGYQSRTFINVKIRPNETTIKNVSLQEQAIEMQGVKVIADRFFSEPTDAPVSATTLDIGEIRTQPSGSYDIQRAIQVIPSVVSSSDGLNEIIIRGGNFGENLFIIDDIEIDNPNHFAFPSSGGGPVSMITPELVRELTFYGGAFPSRYGDKTSSVLEVTTREGDASRFGAKIDISMAGYGGNIEGPIAGGKGNYIFLYHRSFLSLVKNSIGLSAVPNYQSAIGKQVFHLSGGRELVFSQFWGNDWIEISHDDLSAYTASARFEDIYSRSGQYTLGATLKTVYKKSFSKLTVSHNRRWWKNDIYDANTESESTRVSKYHSRENRNTVRYMHRFLKTGIGDLEAGAFLKFDRIDADSYRRPDTLYVWSDESAAGEPDSVFMIHKISGNDLIETAIRAYKTGFYLQWEKQIWWLTLNAGMRYDYFSYTGEGAFAPTFGLKMPLPFLAILRLGAGRYYQSPDYFTLSFTEKNRELKFKYTDQAVVGFDLLLSEDMRARVEGFYKRYNQVPVNHALTTADPYDFAVHSVSVGKGVATGIEMFLQKKVNHNWWATISYSYSKARATDPRYPADNLEYPWDFDYRHVFTTVFGYKIRFLNFDWYNRNRGWLKWLGWLFIIPSDAAECSFRFRAMGGNPYTQMTHIPEYRRWFLTDSQSPNNARIPAYKRLDFHIHHHWFFKSLSIISYIELNNIFDWANVWKYNFVNAENRAGSVALKEATYQWGRTIVGGLTIEL